MYILLKKRHLILVFILFLLAVSLTAVPVFSKQGVSTGATVSVELPIIMYHHITDKKERAGKYTVLVSELENDLKYLKSNGYTAVIVEDLIAFSEGESLPSEKIIMITFDDGFESFYAYAYPLLEKYDMKAVVSVIGIQGEIYSENEDHNINYSNLTWDEIRELSSSKVAEIQSHTYNMHGDGSNGRKGLMKLKSESFEEYRSILSDDLMKNQSLIGLYCGNTPTAIVYPFGAYCDDTEKIIKELGFSCSMTCEEKINYITMGDPESMYRLGRYNREAFISTEDFFAKIENDT